MTQTRAPRELRAVGLICSLAFAFPGLYLVWRNFTSGADPFGLLFSSHTLQPFWRTVRLAILVSASAACLGTSLAWLTPPPPPLFANRAAAVLLSFGEGGSGDRFQRRHPGSCLLSARAKAVLVITSAGLARGTVGLFPPAAWIDFAHPCSVLRNTQSSRKTPSCPALFFFRFDARSLDESSEVPRLDPRPWPAADDPADMAEGGGCGGDFTAFAAAAAAALSAAAIWCPPGTR